MLMSHFSDFAVVPDTKNIRFGMKAIKNVGQGAVEENHPST
jgi:DNA polymerase III alpha subunit